MDKELCGKIHIGLLKVKDDVMTSIVAARQEQGLHATSYSGICAAFSRATMMTSRNLYPGFKAWPKFSGSLLYPIPGDSDEYEQASTSFRMWTGEYGALRLELLDFLIKFYSDGAK